MYGVELYAAVRLAVVDEGLSHHEAGRRFGIDRRTVKKMLSYAPPPGYRRSKPVRRPKLDGFSGIIDAILVARDARGAHDEALSRGTRAERTILVARDARGAHDPCRAGRARSARSLSRGTRAERTILVARDARGAHDEADTDPDVPRKQRHTAHRIFERLRDEHGFAGVSTIQTV